MEEGAAAAAVEEVAAAAVEEVAAVVAEAAASEAGAGSELGPVGHCER